MAPRFGMGFVTSFVAGLILLLVLKSCVPQQNNQKESTDEGHVQNWIYQVVHD